jgi:DNA-binding FrmR family transcriptional regulator
VAQVSAASKALDQVGFKLLATGLSHCLANPKEAAANGFNLDEVEKLFMKLA